MRARDNRSQHPNAVVVLVAEIYSTRSIYCYAGRGSHFRSQRRPTVAAEAAHANTCNGVDDARRGVDAPYSEIDRICDVKIAFHIKCCCFGMVQYRVLGRPAIAAETALANRCARDDGCNRAGTRTDDGSHNSSLRCHHADTRVLIIGNVNIRGWAD
jgi:hypothetical protein